MYFGFLASYPVTRESPLRVHRSYGRREVPGRSATPMCDAGLSGLLILSIDLVTEQGPAISLAYEVNSWCILDEGRAAC